jgi:hypothetical protein
VWFNLLVLSKQSAVKGGSTYVFSCELETHYTVGVFVRTDHSAAHLPALGILPGRFHV